ncbi:MAG TPA: YebC/PmpR family DNA-binding transcriptional regulator, partial [Clostridia bacterium]|nr:YebC/PmpR family DNA-binding transcriptional regulator [Clostridia bacterium]
MAGHSKWNNIKRRKGAVDDKRGKVFSKIGRELQTAVRAAGPDPSTNSLLRDAIAKAKAYNMPNDNINRSIDKAAGDVGGDAFEEMFYEGYGPGGVAIMVRSLTDNRHRTAGDIRHIFSKFGGNLGTDGCVSFQFERKGLLVIERDVDTDEDQVFMDALEAGAEDVLLEDADIIEVMTTVEQYGAVRDVLSEAYEFVEQEIAHVPLTWVSIKNEDDISNLENLVE